MLPVHHDRLAVAAVVLSKEYIRCNLRALLYSVIGSLPFRLSVGGDQRWDNDRRRGDCQGNAERQRRGRKTASQRYPHVEQQAVAVAILNSKFGTRVDRTECIPGKMGKVVYY